MIQEGRPQRPIVVLRPWTLDDLKEMISHLPPASQGGETLAKEFLTFCQQYTPTLSEMRLLLSKHLKPGEFAKIRTKMEGVQRLREAGWNHADNASYRDSVNDLCAAMRDTFPKPVNMSIVDITRQRTGEAPADYLIRLQAAFDDNSGITRPADYPGPLSTTYEVHLKCYFIKGLLPYVRKGVMAPCTPSETVRLAEILNHAQHAFNL